MKVCTKCKKEKEFTEVNIRKNSKSGYRSNCKECRRERDNNRIINIEDKVIKDTKKRDYKKYYELNKDRINERRRYRNKTDNLYYLKNQIRSMNKKHLRKMDLRKILKVKKF